VNAAYPIGFIGLGTMGRRWLTLVKAGTLLLVWNRTPTKAESFAAAAANVAREAADVFAHCATVFSCSSTAKRLTLYSTAVALPSRPGWRHARSSNGYDLAGLFAGARGRHSFSGRTLRRSPGL
jgi:NAD binding domain of 6-phosphogluconate dehydrogenase